MSTKTPRRRKNSIKAETTGKLLDPKGSERLRAEGQEIIPPVCRVSASKIWTFALFPSTPNEIGSIVSCLAKLGKYFCAEEFTPTTNRLHLQGWITFHKKCRPMETVRFFGRWEKTRGSWDDNYRYCALGDNGNKPLPTRTWTNMDILDKVQDPMEGLTYYWWQQYVYDMIQDLPDRRNVYWFYSPTGNNGKTVFCKHLCLLDKHTIFVNGEAKDIKCAIDKMIKQKISPRTVLFYFERDAEQSVSYRAIEAIKDGIFFSSKYESAMTVYNNPHVCCWANFPPKIGKLSLDRWIITNLDLFDKTVGNVKPAALGGQP